MLWHRKYTVSLHSLGTRWSGQSYVLPPTTLNDTMMERQKGLRSASITKLVASPVSSKVLSRLLTGCGQAMTSDPHVSPACYDSSSPCPFCLCQSKPIPSWLPRTMSSSASPSENTGSTLDCTATASNYLVLHYPIHQFTWYNDWDKAGRQEMLPVWTPQLGRMLGHHAETPTSTYCQEGQSAR